MKPTVSVIIPVYNGEATIGRCLDSLLAQSYPQERYEIIVVENGSTDRTVQVVESYRGVKLVVSEKRGPAAARNRGLEESEAELIAFTDADCTAHPDWLAELVSAYDDPQVGGAGGVIEAEKHDERNLVERFCDEREPLINFISGENEFLPHLYTANASYRRDLLTRVRGFDGRMMTGEDVDLAWRAQLHTDYRLVYAPNAIIYHRHRSSVRKLMRQYRQYGFGEIMLDTIYGGYPGYPRSLRFQAGRIARQLMALPRYSVSIIKRGLMRLGGRMTEDEAAKPALSLLIEWSNIVGKVEALISTRLMRNAGAVLDSRPEEYISRFY